ncbi:hypothetical protein KSD_47120 [Ktedonobacter sp. SOSP1-85]|nr:hypothetical protein KSD_47120 [Ktedonobacter sp. SOSP1-85]
MREAVVFSSLSPFFLYIMEEVDKPGTVMVSVVNEPNDAYTYLPTHYAILQNQTIKGKTCWEYILFPTLRY